MKNKSVSKRVMQKRLDDVLQNVETPTAPQCRAAEKMTSDSLLTAGSVKNVCFISLAT